MINQVFDYSSYRKIVLNSINPSKYHLVNHKDYQTYKNYTKYIFEFNNKKQEPLNHMVGYYIPTIDGKKWMPIFNHDIGRLRNKLNIELKEAYYVLQERKIDKNIECLYQIGFPLTSLKIIRKYLINFYII
jgi:hypothetical protein